jgi:hypothetical protein
VRDVIELLVHLAAPSVAIIIAITFLGSFFVTIRPDAHTPPGTARKLFSVRTIDATGWVVVVLLLEIAILSGFRALPQETSTVLLIRGLLQASIITVLVVRLIHWRRLQHDAAREREALAAIHKVHEEEVP